MDVYTFVKIIERKPINTKSGGATLLKIQLQEQGGYQDSLVVETFDAALVEAVSSTQTNTTVSIEYKAKSKQHQNRWFTDVKLTKWLPQTVYKAGVHYDIEQQQKTESNQDSSHLLSGPDLDFSDFPK